MGFKIPKYLKHYLESTKYRKPFESFVNNSTYYSQLNWQWIQYLETVVRPCIAYSTASVDGLYNTSLSTSTGLSILRGATRLVAGDKHFFIGNDESCAFLSDIWAPAVNFNRFKVRAVSFLLSAGTGVIKVNKDGFGKTTLSAFRIDRTLFTADESGNITYASFFISLLSELQNTGERSQYWLVEERKYNDEGNKVLCYKVFARGGTATSPTLPSPAQQGVPFNELPQTVRTELRRIGATDLNRELPLNTYDGLGVWLMGRTAANSCVPDAPLGDPLLYGCLDILWSIDVVFSGSIVDVLNGEGKILVPKQFLQATLNKLQAQYPGTEFSVTTAELQGFEDESFVYVLANGVDKEKQTPVPVQFDIRAEQYGKMLEIYERLACVRAGFSPTSIFPYLTPDNSAKTAREVSAEENLTRASIKEVHELITPVFNRALREVLRQEGFTPDVQIQLGDYIGNKLEFDQNVRENYAAGLLPQDVAVKQINNLTDNETDEYIGKIDAEKKKQAEEQSRMYGGGLFNDKDYFGEDKDGGSE